MSRMKRAFTKAIIDPDQTSDGEFLLSANAAPSHRRKKAIQAPKLAKKAPTHLSQRQIDSQMDEVNELNLEDFHDTSRTQADTTEDAAVFQPQSQYARNNRQLYLDDLQNQPPSSQYDDEELADMLDDMINQDLQSHDAQTEVNNQGEDDIQELPEEVRLALEEFESQSSQPAVVGSGLTSFIDQATTEVDPEVVVSEIMQMVQSSVSAKTVKTYKGPISKFLVWCSSQNYPAATKQIVTEKKLLVYLKKEVVDGSDQRMKAGASRVGIQSVKNAISAVTHLFQHQVNQNMNMNPHPRGKLIKSYIKYLKRLENDSNKEQFKDRAKNTIGDGYNNDQELEMLAGKYFTENFTESPAIRMRSMLLVSHYGMLRGSNVRDVEFADLMVVKGDGKGATAIDVMVLLINNGKTNYVNRQEYAQMTRAKNVATCGVGSLALQMFNRFNTQNCVFPDLTEPKNFYTLKLYPTSFSRPLDGMSYNAHSSSVKKVLNLCGLNSSKTTHISRKSAVNCAATHEIDSGRLAAQGRWSSNAMDLCYMGIQWDNVVKMAGFGKKDSFIIHRAAVEPPQVLLDLVFPQLTKYQSQLQTSKDLSTIGFIKAMNYLRKVFLQDSALLIKLYPDLNIWNDELFDMEEYSDFYDLVHAACDQAELNGNELLSRLAPEIAESLKFESEQTRNIINQQSTLLEQIQGQLNDTKQAMVDIFSGKSSIKINVQGYEAQQESSAQHQQSVANQDVEQIPKYKMSRSIVTVADLYREYNVGIGGGMAVKDLEANYKAAWRRDPTESKFFNRRMVIIKEAQDLVESNQCGNIAEAVETLEQLRTSKNWSLDKLMKAIKDQQKEK